MNKLSVLALALVLTASSVLAIWTDADFNNDGNVNIVDYGVFTSWYGSNNCTGPINGSNSTGNNWCGGADLDTDGDVDLTDAGIFSGYYGCYNGTNESRCYN